MAKRPDLTGMSIVVVDDNRNFLARMAVILRSFNVGDVIERIDARSALQVLRTRRIDLLMADKLMPGIGGFELISQIRASRYLQQAELPIICMSGDGGQASFDEAVRVGADDFLVKPIRPSDVFRRVIKHITDPLPRVRAPAYFGPDRRVGLSANHAVEQRLSPPGSARPGPGDG